MFERPHPTLLFSIHLSYLLILVFPVIALRSYGFALSSLFFQDLATHILNCFPLSLISHYCIFCYHNLIQLISVFSLATLVYTRSYLQALFFIFLSFSFSYFKFIDSFSRLPFTLLYFFLSVFYRLLASVFNRIIPLYIRHQCHFALFPPFPTTTNLISIPLSFKYSFSLSFSSTSSLSSSFRPPVISPRPNYSIQISLSVIHLLTLPTSFLIYHFPLNSMNH